MYRPNIKTYIGSGKVVELMAALNATGVRTLVFDDDLSSKQQRNLEVSTILSIVAMLKHPKL
jgi:GTP-binding protein HflX